MSGQGRCSASWTWRRGCQAGIRRARSVRFSPGPSDQSGDFFDTIGIMQQFAAQSGRQAMAHLDFVVIRLLRTDQYRVSRPAAHLGQCGCWTTVERRDCLTGSNVNSIYIRDR